MINKISIIKSFFPFLKLKEKNLSWYKRLYIYFETFISIMMISWTICCVFGYKYFFINPYTYHHLDIYMQKKLISNDRLDNLVYKVDSKLNKYAIDFKKLHANVYFVDSDFLYYFGLIPGAYFIMSKISYTFNGSTYFHYANIEKNIAFEDQFDKVSLDTVLAHELVHTWQNNKYTFYDSFMIPIWIREGYAVYVSEEKYKNIKTNNDKNIFLKKVYQSKINHKKSKYPYILWGFMVKHAIEKMHKSVDDLHLGKVEYDEVLDSLLNEYHITKESK